MLACPDCTAWHLPAARARHHEVLTTPAAAPAADRFAPRAEATDTPPARLHLVA